MGESGLKESSAVERSGAGWRCSGNTGCNTDRGGMQCIAGERDDAPVFKATKSYIVRLCIFARCISE